MWMVVFWHILANNPSKRTPMKKIILFSILISLSFSAFAKTGLIEISNPSEFDRKNELIEVDFSKICKENSKSFIIKDASGQEVPYQIISKKDKPEIILIQVSVAGKGKSAYQIVAGKPAPVKARTSGRYIPERKDDFAWENDLAAYRMYGPALVKEKPSNGVDLWLKRTSELIVDTFYHKELKKGKSYHVDHGKGLDCYKVGQYLGCGGIAPYIDGKLYVHSHYNAWQVLENGPLRTRFKLTYDTVKINGKVYKQDLIITADAGSALNKAEVIISGEKTNMNLAAGIFLHDGKGLKKAGKNFITYAENAVSDAGIPSGRNYVGVVFNSGKITFSEDKIHSLIISPYKTTTTFTYYFGGGWSKWQYPTDGDWYKAMEEFAEKVKKPLKIKVK